MKKLIYRKLLKDYMSFFFIALISSGLIIWVFQAVNFLDIMIEDGREYTVYINYSLLNFPKIISRLFPFVLFFSIFYVLSKYELNNELIILITTSIFIAIAYSIIVFTLISIFKESEKKDERDYILELKSYKTSNTIFQISILLLICSIIFNPISNHYEFTPTLIAALLIIITLFCSAGKSVSLLYFYRRSI